MSRLDLRPGLRVLDVGAGSGALSIPAARAGAEVLAIDIAPTMVERLTARAEADGLTTLRAEVGDGASLDLDDDSFDVAVSLNAVSLFPRPDRRPQRDGAGHGGGGEVVVATFGPIPKVEFVAFFFGALRAVVPDQLPPPDQPLPPFRLAEPETFRRAAGQRVARVGRLPQRRPPAEQVVGPFDERGVQRPPERARHRRQPVVLLAAGRRHRCRIQRRSRDPAGQTAPPPSAPTTPAGRTPAGGRPPAR